MPLPAILTPATPPEADRGKLAGGRPTSSRAQDYPPGAGRPALAGIPGAGRPAARDPAAAATGISAGAAALGRRGPKHAQVTAPADLEPLADRFGVSPGHRRLPDGVSQRLKVVRGGLLARRER